LLFLIISYYYYSYQHSFIYIYIAIYIRICAFNKNYVNYHTIHHYCNIIIIHTHTRARARARTHTRTHAHTHIYIILVKNYLSLNILQKFLVLFFYVWCMLIHDFYMRSNIHIHICYSKYVSNEYRRTRNVKNRWSAFVSFLCFVQLAMSIFRKVITFRTSDTRAHRYQWTNTWCTYALGTLTTDQLMDHSGFSSRARARGDYWSTDRHVTLAARARLLDCDHRSIQLSISPFRKILAEWNKFHSKAEILVILSHDFW